MTTTPDLIVTRHRGLLEWLARRLPAPPTERRPGYWDVDPDFGVSWVYSDGPDRPGYGDGRPGCGHTIPVLSHVLADDVRGLHVLGVLPLALAAEAASVTEVSMPGLRPDQRGKELTPDEMDAAGAELRTYSVLRPPESAH